MSGLIGASPGSDFCLSHPRFGFFSSNKEDDWKPQSLEMFLGEVNPQKCIDRMIFTRIIDPYDEWTIHGRIHFGEFSTNTDILIDTGSGSLVLPEKILRFSSTLSRNPRS